MTNIQFTNLKASNFVFDYDLEHPNKMPFSGILTYFDTPSDEAPHGSNGRKVLIPSAVGVPALDSMVGMAVNFVRGREHAPQDKIGIITDASAGEPTEHGTPVYISGFIYAHDFPDDALEIKMAQSSLGFSYETTNTLLTDSVYNGEAVALVTQVVFTGASILTASDGAYTKTSLAASAETEIEIKEGETSMELTELMASIEKLFDTKIEDLKKELQASAEAEETPAEEPKQEETPVEEPKVEEPVVEEAKKAPEKEETPEEKTPEVEPEAGASALQAAADLKVELEAVRKELSDLKAAADIQASARKSIAFPQTLIQKYELNEEEESTTLMASIDEREDLSISERLALKMELRDKQRKQSN